MYLCSMARLARYRCMSSDHLAAERICSADSGHARSTEEFAQARIQFSLQVKPQASATTARAHARTHAHSRQRQTAGLRPSNMQRASKRDLQLSNVVTDASCEPLTCVHHPEVRGSTSGIPRPPRQNSASQNKKPRIPRPSRNMRGGGAAQPRAGGPPLSRSGCKQHAGCRRTL